MDANRENDLYPSKKTNAPSGVGGIKIAFDKIYSHPLPEGHRFPMLKYELIPGQLLYEGSITTNNLFSPLPATEDTILLTHEKSYYNKLINQTLTAQEQRKIGFPQSPELTLRERIITQGTIDCCYYAKKYGVALNVAGGTHHAFADHGEGFCLLNDMAQPSLALKRCLTMPRATLCSISYGHGWMKNGLDWHSRISAVMATPMPVQTSPSSGPR